MEEDLTTGVAHKVAVLEFFHSSSRLPDGHRSPFVLAQEAQISCGQGARRVHLGQVFPAWDRSLQAPRMRGKNVETGDPTPESEIPRSPLDFHVPPLSPQWELSPTHLLFHKQVRRGTCLIWAVQCVHYLQHYLCHPAIRNMHCALCISRGGQLGCVSPEFCSRSLPCVIML